MKPIKNYENYLINEQGEVYSTISNKVIKTHINVHGYKVVELYHKPQIKCTKVLHRILWETFREPNLTGKLKFIDGNKQNVTLNNLAIAKRGKV